MKNDIALRAPLVIIGCGGHARSVLDVALNEGWKDVLIVDELGKPGESIFEYPVYTSLFDADNSYRDIFVALGDNYERKRRINDILTHYKQFNLVNIISSHAYLSPRSSLGKGIFIGNFAHIGPQVVIDDNTIINTHAIVEHECYIGNSSHISIGAHLAGKVRIGEYCMIGAGAIIRDRISIHDHVTIGAGAVVVKDISTPGVYVGNPARELIKK
ncbi:MAG TPA: acetyltransferase [Methanolinea sp.]|jgi:sugar O-acyltransferase (sialic acid O-acetyltransferase NeuD family)|nr:acetyltransferase [Methanolinea sp.]